MFWEASNQKVIYIISNANLACKVKIKKSYYKQFPKNYELWIYLPKSIICYFNKSDLDVNLI